MSDISSLAQISKQAIIGKNVTVSAFTTIYEDVEIGENTWIAPNVTIFQGSRIGKNCKIFSGAVIGAVPQDLKFHGEYSTAVIGDNTTIRECVTINRGTEDKETTTVGSNCLIMAYSHVAHDCIVGNHCILSNGTQLAGHVTIEDWAIMGGMSGALQRTRVGAHAFVSGGTLIGRDVPPFTKVIYTPGNYAGINTLGLLRRKYSREQMQYISDIYKLIYQSELNLSQAVEQIKNTIADSEDKKSILTFIAETKNGIILKSNNRNESNSIE